MKNFTIRSRGGGLSCDKYHIVTKPRAANIPASGSHTTFRSIPPNGISQFFACNESNTAFRAVLLILLQYNQGRGRATITFPLLEDTCDVSAGFDYFQHESLYTQRRLRPLARRDAITLRPPLVAMRERKPWHLARLRLFG